MAGLDGNVDAGVLASIGVRTDEIAGYTAELRNDTGQLVTLEAARLLPLQGFPLPEQSLRLAVQTGRVSVGTLAGWPPGHHNRDIRLAPFAGYRVRSGHTVKILYGVSAAAPGDYGIKGLRLSVELAGSQQSVDALGGSVTCVSGEVRLCPGSVDSRATRVVDGEV